MSKLKLGIIGLSAGNGHPYSWAAIFNGYDKAHMKNCPFPGIPAYLAKQQFPQDTIKDAEVTHIWTQDKKLSTHIARSSRIEQVVDNFTDLIGKVDGILLARDDAEKHFELSAPFLKKGLPIYIDKPLAYTTKEARKILSLQRYPGQIFTCSALRYAKEFQLSKKDLKSIGTIRHIDACVMKDWHTYGIHIIEPVMTLLKAQDRPMKIHGLSHNDRTMIQVIWKSGISTSFTSLGKTACPISIRVFGDKSFKVLTFEDSFFAFREALRTFVTSIKNKKAPISEDFIYNVIQIIERGAKC